MTGVREPTEQADGGCCANKYDLLFMIDDSPSMAPLQQKLLAQLPTFMKALQNLPEPPSLHIAVISSDLGAPSDAAGQIGCNAVGDQGAFQNKPRGTCTDSTLDRESTFIVDDPTTGTTNFGLPESTGLPAVFQCIGMLGASGCGFGHPLESVDRALGADGRGPPPPGNEGFLRSDAYLGIIFITNADDASTPGNTTVFSLNGHPQNITNPDGPLANYRQNGGPRSPHLCQDPSSANPTAYETPPILVPSDAQGPATAPTLTLVNCKDDDSGSSAFIPVAKFVSDIKALKQDPDNDILVSGIIAPTTPFEIAWYPATDGQDVQPGELWPALMNSCGAQVGDNVSPNATQFTTDGSFGDPGIRLAQFMNAFSNSVLASICDPNYADALLGIAQYI